MKWVGTIGHYWETKQSNEPLPIVELQTWHVANHDYRNGEECAGE